MTILVIVIHTAKTSDGEVVILRHAHRPRYAVEPVSFDGRGTRQLMATDDLVEAAKVLVQAKVEL